MINLDAFREWWAVDTEFTQPPGSRPTPICLVARELRTGRTIRLTDDELHRLRQPPFNTGPDSVVIAHYAPAELSVFLALGWPMPENIFDTFCEHRNLTNGLPVGASQVAACLHHGVPCMEAAYKDANRDLAIRGGPFTQAEMVRLVNYCTGDVDDLSGLFAAMVPKVRRLDHALLRGRYTRAVAAMEHAGLPIDVDTLALMVARWEDIKHALIARVDSGFGVYEDTTFKTSRFEEWLASHNIRWPRHESGELELDGDTFTMMARSHPSVAPLRELRHALSELRLNALAVGPDGRNRTGLSMFRARTGRNQPSNTKFIFGPSCWIRSLIKPSPGMAVAYIDWSQQEIGIGAVLSGDQHLLDVYVSSDPYIQFAKLCDAVPPDASKHSHPEIRERFKQCLLAVNYRMGSYGLAHRIGKMEPYARELLELHRRMFPRFWSWSEAAIDAAFNHLQISTCFGWALHVGPSPDPFKPSANPRSLGNFPCQAHGSEMLRLACCLMVERGVPVIAPVHDAVMVEGPAEQIDDIVTAAQSCMAEASREILHGFELRTDAKVVAYPDRYSDPRGVEFWNTVCDLVGADPSIRLPEIKK